MSQNQNLHDVAAGELFLERLSATTFQVLNIVLLSQQEVSFGSSGQIIGQFPAVDELEELFERRNIGIFDRYDLGIGFLHTWMMNVL